MATLQGKDKDYFINLDPKDITEELIISLFGDKFDRKLKKEIPSKYKTSDEIVLEKGDYFNATKITTNAGLMIFNKLIIERDFKDVVGYVNSPVNSNVLGDVEGKLAKALLTDKITALQMADYLNRVQWLSMQFHTMFSGSFTMPTLKPSKKVMQRRDQLVKQYKKELDKGDVITSVKIEKELLKLADEELKGDTGMDLYKSGARGSFGNNFKTTSVMKGAVYNPTSGEFDIVQSNFMEGIRKEDIPVFANAIITGAYPKAIGTATSGYFSKQIIAALQAVQLDEKGTDCGTKGHLTLTILPSMKADFMYRFIIEGTKLVMLDETNIDKYSGKTVKMRSPMFCVGEKVCSKCAGEMYDKLKIKNIGLTGSRVSSTLLNLSMKKFHDTSSKIYEVNKDMLTL